MPNAVRTPLAWLKPDEAVAYLLGGTAEAQQDTTPFLAKWGKARSALDARPPHAATSLTQALPPELVEMGAQFRERPEVKLMFQGYEWDLRMIDLSTVLAFQKQILTEEIDGRVANNTADDLVGLFRVGLPEEKNESLLTAVDQSSRAFTITSLNPNLSIMSMASAELPSSQVPGGTAKQTKVYGFVITVKPSFLTAVEYRGRLYIRDGYHRSYGLIKKGIHQVPAIVVQAKNFKQMGANGPAFLPEEVIFGERPLMLRDYLDDEVSATVQYRVPRKVIRVRAEEYVLPL
jgi:hypothetical protein